MLPPVPPAGVEEMREGPHGLHIEQELRIVGRGVQGQCHRLRGPGPDPPRKHHSEHQGGELQAAGMEEGGSAISPACEGGLQG